MIVNTASSSMFIRHGLIHIDFVGPISPSSKSGDYFTKWVEAVALPKAPGMATTLFKVIL